MGSLFKPVKQVKIFQTIVEQIQDAIFSSHLKPGEKLPSERQLQTIFKAGRPAVREALRVIENRGFITINLGKQGGAVVTSKKVNPLINQFELLTRSQQFSLNHIAEFREQLEGEIAQIAVDKSSDKDLHHLNDTIEKAKAYSTHKKNSIKKFIEMDTKFHLRISLITGNKLYTHMLSAMYSLNSYYKRFYKPNTDIMDENLEDLTQIFAAFSNRESAKAKTLSQRHIRKFNTNY